MADVTWQEGGDSVARIDVRDDRQVLDWAGRLGVTPDDVRGAIRVAGDDADAVREYLYLHHWSPGKSVSGPAGAGRWRGRSDPFGRFRIVEGFVRRCFR